MSALLLAPTYIGDVGNSGVYRLDLSQFGTGAILAITIYDDNIISGGTGGASGFDLDFASISSTFTSSPSVAASLISAPVFNFNSAGVVYRPGFLQTYVAGQPVEWNTSTLFGTVGDVYSPSISTLSVRDALLQANGGSLSFGEGGQVTFLLNYSMLTSGQYLYIGDAGLGNDGVYVSVSDVRAAPAYTGLTLTGTSGSDSILLGQGINANLGSGDDLIDGSGGNDTVYGGAGDDTVRGGPGNDVINGGGDTDRAVFSGPRSNYTITSGFVGYTIVTDNTGADGTDSIINVEELQFSDQVVILSTPGISRYGGALADVLLGAGLDDVLVGNDGNDYLYARDGRDYLYGGAGIDVLLGEGGDDVEIGGDGQDYLFGGSGADTLYGGNGVDVLNGESGNDLMFGDAGGDYLYGGTGNDRGYGGDGNDIYVGGDGDELFSGDAGQDYAYMGNGDDTMYGGAGVDVLLGQGGNDLFDGGADTDYLFLGSGAHDTVLFNLNSGVDVVNDFETSNDLVRLQGTGFTNFSQVQGAMTDYGSFSILTINSNTAIWFIGVSSSQLSSANFSFT